MTTRFSLFLFSACFSLASITSGKVDMEMVFVGPANPADFESGHGRVDYNYYIGKYEITNAQYLEFLNSVAAADLHDLYHQDMTFDNRGGILQTGSSGNHEYWIKPGYDNLPVVFVSYWDAMRFVNWLSNGQPVGEQGPDTTETGVYDLNGLSDDAIESVIRDSEAWDQGFFALPSRDEFYKAAYYDPTAPVTGYYWLYPTRSDDPPGNVIEDPDPGNNANIRSAAGYSVGAPEYLSEVGEYENSTSYFGTCDQGGNVTEWIDPVSSSSIRQSAGGDYSGLSAPLRKSNVYYSHPPAGQNYNLGFRVVRQAVWAGYSIENAAGETPTDVWLHTVWANLAPWVFSEGVEHWLFVPAHQKAWNGIWLHGHDFEWLLLVDSTSASWAYSYRLSRWVYRPSHRPMDSQWVFIGE